MLSIYKIAGKIELKSGLHIGAGNDIIEIGGLDNPVAKDRKGRPYIPGSSIKGKLRSMMEWQLSKVSSNGEPHSCSDPENAISCQICRIFGPHKAAKVKLGPPRLIVRDAILESNDEEGESHTEAKYENVINRVNGTAEHPRQLERVHAGTFFSFEIIYRNFVADEDDAKSDRKAIELALKNLEHDYLGGSGSRGSGKVCFIHDGWSQVYSK